MQHKIFCIHEFINTELATDVQRAFRLRFNIQPPTRKSICRWNHQFEQTGCLCKGESSGRPRVSEENVRQIQESSECSPRKSTRSVSRELGILQPTVWHVLRHHLPFNWVHLFESPVFYCAFIIYLIIKPCHVLSNKQTLLNKSLKYNLSYKQKDWIRMLALEAERAISQLPISGQEYIWYQVANNIKHLYKQYDKNKLYNTILDKKEKRILNHIIEKLISNNAIISKADKRSSIVIIYQNIFHEKVTDFIHNNNNFTNMTGDLTKSSRKNSGIISMNVPI